MTQDVTTPEPEVNEAPETTENETQDTDTSEPTVGEAQSDTSNKPSQVPMARLDKEIQRRKELEKELEALRAEKKDEGSSNPDKEPDVKELAKKLQTIEEREAAAKRDAIISENISKALESAPEYKDIVNMDVIKQMALNPANKDKTYTQLLDEAYGNAVGGKRTIETTTPRGGAKDTQVDIDRARKDAAYRREVLADPDLRKQYNQGLENRIPL